MEGNEGLEKILHGSYDLILLDVMLPGVSGFDICKTARRNGVDTPVILLTARGEEMDKVLGLELGADDYITKPFGLRELLARIRANIRRAPLRREEGDDLVTIGNISISFKNCQAFQGNTEVKMSHKEIEVLQYLYENEGRTVHRDDLMSNVWEVDHHITTRTVDNFILRLRQKIEPDPNNPRIILTVHGTGYKLAKR
jgi:DNA-binding response OmpR family regulator